MYETCLLNHLANKNLRMQKSLMFFLEVIRAVICIVAWPCAQAPHYEGQWGAWMQNLTQLFINQDYVQIVYSNLPLPENC
jgi:hypothetical protein